MANDRTGRDRVFTTLAVLMGVMALSNFSKPFGEGPESNAGFVFFGRRLSGTANAIVGPLFGFILAAYAYGVWTMKHWVVPLAFAYAVYVILNLILFVAKPPAGSHTPPLFMLVYAVVAIGVSSGGALYLHRHRDRLS
jgi:hypothetical protein